MTPSDEMTANKSLQIAIEAIREQARREENEACAKIAVKAVETGDVFHDELIWNDACLEIAAAIRARVKWQEDACAAHDMVSEVMGWRTTLASEQKE